MFTPDPYRHLVRHLAEGPAFIDDSLDKIGTALGMAPGSTDHLWLHRLAILEQAKPRLDQRVYPFLEGYLQWQCGNTAGIPEQVGVHYEKALNAFTTFTAQTGNDAELQYIALWQTAMMRLAFGEPWPVVEELLLQAFNTAPRRGEALQVIIEHYLYTHYDPKIAYIYVWFAYKHFFRQVPASKWLVDPAFYEWLIVEYHLLVLYAFGKQDAVAEDLQTLQQQMAKHPHLFTAEDETRIREYQQQLLHSPIS